jgi:hypothetical protein
MLMLVFAVAGSCESRVQCLSFMSELIRVWYIVQHLWLLLECPDKPHLLQTMSMFYWCCCVLFLGWKKKAKKVLHRVWALWPGATQNALGCWQKREPLPFRSPEEKIRLLRPCWYADPPFSRPAVSVTLWIQQEEVVASLLRYSALGQWRAGMWFTIKVTWSFKNLRLFFIRWRLHRKRYTFWEDIYIVDTQVLLWRKN